IRDVDPRHRGRGPARDRAGRRLLLPPGERADVLPVHRDRRPAHRPALFGGRTLGPGPARLRLTHGRHRLGCRDAAPRGLASRREARLAGRTRRRELHRARPRIEAVRPRRAARPAGVPAWWAEARGAGRAVSIHAKGNPPPPAPPWAPPRPTVTG